MPVIAFRLLVLATVWVFASSSFSLAGGGGGTTESATTAPAQTSSDAEPGVLLVPDVRNMPYVFAKGTLEDSGFAWRVEGAVEGYATNVVAKQSVEPGVRVKDTGAPTIVLHLTKSSQYDEVGVPDNTSPYPGTKVVLAKSTKSAAAATEQSSSEPAATDTAPAQTTPATTAAPTQADNAAETQPTTTATTHPATTQATTSSAAGSTSRPPAFHVTGAPKEPLDEMPLTQRAKLLGAWLAGQTSATPAFWDHYTYQHAWVVAGAKFGWWHGAEALRTLLRVDAVLAKRFGHAASLQQTARAALVLVERRSHG